ncbi:HD domain-containing phosphohydrolase [uncultured Azonexus sp.]|uniref:response regulator n=1 Tax=uncultured Azonexus sp. TaxID=520307 RepID=UPI00262A4C43|nr:HD domain-containing phosphohydrolase [uncultured Azonexus sp.]
MANESRPTILVVDDTPDNLAVVGGILGSEYRVRVANSGERALHVANSDPRPELILLDIMMPGMDGYETLRRLREDPATRDIPVIFVTAMDADNDEAIGLQMGAVDYVTKPIRPAILLARIRTRLELQAARDHLARQNEILEARVAKRTREVELIKDVGMHALATLAEKRDNETGNHLLRTRGYIEVLMTDLAQRPEFAEQLTPLRQRLIAKAAPLHDIGKVGIPDAILLKPGRLTPEEFEIMKTHARIGADALDEAIARVLADRRQNQPAEEERYSLDFLEAAREIAGGHHEKWDGSGYPHGLAGEAISVEARIVAVADVFDALTSQRPYKPAWPLERALDLLRAESGRHFWPDAVQALLARIDDAWAVRQQWLDDGPEKGTQGAPATTDATVSPP